MMPPKKKKKKPSCGRRSKKRVPSRGRIIGGITARAGNHPWMAAIYIDRSDFCAGTLISSCWVLPLKSRIRVVLGQQDFNVTVLVKLKKENGACARRTPFIRPICLPDVGMTFPDYYCCTISGWGHMDEKLKEYSNLQEAGVRLIPQDKCASSVGDSGGPLACARADVSFLYGIISWGDGCGRGKPGVYTRVVNYMDWINSGGYFETDPSWAHTGPQPQPPPPPPPPQQLSGIMTEDDGFGGRGGILEDEAMQKDITQLNLNHQS
ncbi:hypothetical protein CRUP_001305 [Coryphaenoides rupestris]|nr:hypothetical protein CRUP_001305 [Coryphaenoides rupestris]